MTQSRKGRLWLLSGLAGLLAIVCYILAITLPWPETQPARSLVLLVVGAWPVLSIVYSYGLYDYIAAEHDGVANRLAFIFGVAAFTTVLAMLIVQMAVVAGLVEVTQQLDEVTARALRRGLRLVDLGLDVAWDMLGSVALIFLGLAMRWRRGLGLGWAVPSASLGIALIGLNAATFPWPPAGRGLFDIGPLVGLFIMALAGRLTYLGWRAGRVG